MDKRAWVLEADDRLSPLPVKKKKKPKQSRDQAGHEGVKPVEDPVLYSAMQKNRTINNPLHESMEPRTVPFMYLQKIQDHDHRIKLM